MMNKEAVVKRPVMRYYGGKWRLGPWICSHMPPHDKYVEPYLGAGSVLLQKRPARIEVGGDLYGRTVNVFRVLRDPEQSSRLQSLLRWTACSEAEYHACREISPDPVEDARRMIVLGHQAHGATGACGKLSGWRRGVRPRGPGTAREWRDLWQHVPSWGDRMRGVYLEQKPALEIMVTWDCEETLFYVDPPYVSATRSNAKSYAFEMTDADHEALAEAVKTLRGMVMVSGYHSPLYDRLFNGWRRVERRAATDAQGSRTEVLWMNFEPRGELI